MTEFRVRGFRAKFIVASLLIGVVLFSLIEYLSRQILFSTMPEFTSENYRWYDWVWKTDPGTHPDYAEFKAEVYSLLDPRFYEYFDDQPPGDHPTR